MDLSTLPFLVRRSKKRVGRGHGSGKVKTSGRGTKGQGARGSIRLGFEGGQIPLIERLPYLRGKGRNRSLKPKAYPVQVSALASLPKGSTVTLSFLKEHHIVDGKTRSVKILGTDELSVPLTVTVPCSKSAQGAIEKAGGSVKVE